MGGVGATSLHWTGRAPLGSVWALSCCFPCWWDIFFKSGTWGVSGSRAASQCRMQPSTLSSSARRHVKALIFFPLNECISPSPPRLSKLCNVWAVFCFPSQEAKGADERACLRQLFSPLDGEAPSAHPCRSELELCGVVLPSSASARQQGWTLRVGAEVHSDGAGILGCLGLDTEPPK